MPEGFVQLSPDSTGAKMRTRERIILTNTVEEQYVIPQAERIVLSRTWYSSLRVPNQASTAAPMLTVYNTGTNPVALRRLSVEVDSITASTVASPYLRLYRLAGTAPTGGATLSAVQQDTNDAAPNAGIVVRQAASADTTSSAITATAGVTGPLWAQIVPRWQTLVGYQSLPVMNMLPDDSMLNSEDPLILRTNQGCMVRMEAAAAPTAAVWQFIFKMVLGEFILP